jgi:hypothetical protein
LALVRPGNNNNLSPIFTGDIMNNQKPAESKPTPSDEWEWFGHAAHFICGSQCRFHLATRIGPYLVSTVGEYVPDEPVREILAYSRNVILEGKGDYRLADYMKKIGFENMGCDRKYETYVFWLGDKFERCNIADCGCGMPKPANWGEIWGKGANIAGEARNNHIEACHLAASGAIGKGEANHE